MPELANQQSLGTTLSKGFKFNFRQYAMFFALIGLWLVFTIITAAMGKTSFLSPRNITNLMLQNSYIAILAIGMVLVIVAGHIDLSVGFLAGFCGAVAAILQAKFNWPDAVAIGAALIAGILVGMWQGFWIAYRRIPAFIVTLAGMLIFKGLIILVTGGQTIYLRGNDFKAIASGYVPQMFMQGKVGTAGIPFHDTTALICVIAIVAFIVMEFRNRSVRKQYGFEVNSTPRLVGKLVLVSAMIAVFFSFLALYQGIPYVLILVVALVFIYQFITQKTVFGRHVYALGGNKEAARLSGINIQFRTLMIFVSMGLLSAVSGVVYTARLNSATASAGTLFELDAIAAAIIGGTSTMGGEGTIAGAILGALIMGSLNNGMELLNVPSELQFVIKGLILLLAVWFDIATRNKKK